MIKDLEALRTRYLETKKLILDLSTHYQTPPPTLIAVSKKNPADSIRALYELGQRDFGENYVQELLLKAQALSDLKDLRWHYLGALQSNKLSNLVQIGATIHALQEKSHAEKLAQLAHKAGQTLGVFIALANGLESHKSGLSQPLAEELANLVQSHAPALELLGLFCLPPPLEQLHAEERTKLYGTLCGLRTSFPGAQKLSLGMSQDLAYAIEAGSTHLRIGSALFGPRI